MKQMYRIIYAIALIGFLSVESMAQIATPQPSPAGSASSVVGLTEISIDYFRPKMKGRTIFGEGDVLIPNGQIWRTGANSGTVVSFQDEVTIQGKKVAAGEYLLFTIPGTDSWSVMLYSDLSLGGNTAGYDKSKEVASFSVKPSKLGHKVETLTFNIADISEDNTSANIEMTWESTSIKLPVVVNFDAKVMESIERNTKINPNNYAAAANYYFQTGKDPKKAAEWMQMAVDGGANQFWNLHTLAQIQKAAGDIEGARATATKSLEMAKGAASDFGYIKLNEDLLSTLPAPSSKGKKKK